MAHVRIMHDRNLNVTLDSGKLSSWEALKAVVCDFKCWLFLLLYTLDCTCTTISYFIPTILKTLGYTSVTAQWMTVPIWTTGGICMLALSYSSDKTQDRRWHIFGLFVVPIVACLVSLFVEQGAAKYAMMCFLIAGIYTAVPLILNWASEVVSFPAQKRSVSIAFINSFGHLSLIYGSYLWPSANAPRHVLGFSAVAALCGAAALLAMALPWIFKMLPKQPATRAERAILAADEDQRAASTTVQEIK
jgi:predicted MFS family arabinose efflux permease